MASNVCDTTRSQTSSYISLNGCRATTRRMPACVHEPKLIKRLIECSIGQRAAHGPTRTEEEVSHSKHKKEQKRTKPADTKRMSCLVRFVSCFTQAPFPLAHSPTAIWVGIQADQARGKGNDIDASARPWRGRPVGESYAGYIGVL